MKNNKIWRYKTGYLMGYTEDKDLMRRIKRYKTKNGWAVFAEYFKQGRLFALQYKIPIKQRRQAMRMFGVTEISD